MSKNTYTFPAIFTYEEDGISINFYDIEEAITCADIEEKALHNAEEVLGLCLVSRERDGLEIPEATPIQKVDHDKNQKVVLITVDMVKARQETIEVNGTINIV